MMLTPRYLKLIMLLSVLIPVITACSSDKEIKEKKPGQALASVNGNEITMLQLNEELARAGVRADQFEVASKQILESLIARQLIVDEAIRNKLDRTPEVMQARERANAQVIAQAYLQRVTNKLGKPTKAEIEEYYQKHPEYFEKRKQLDLTTIRIALSDFSDDLKAFLDNTKSIDEVSIWLDKRKIKYIRNPVSRSTADLPPNIVSMLLEKNKNHIFVTQEQGNSLLVSVNSIKDSPLSLTTATPQIERFLINQKYKQATEEEVKRLRSAAKIEYFGDKTSNSNQKDTSSNIQSVLPTEEASDLLNQSGKNPPESLPGDRSIERGMMGLK